MAGFLVLLSACGVSIHASCPLITRNNQEVPESRCFLKGKDKWGKSALDFCSSSLEKRNSFPHAGVTTSSGYLAHTSFQGKIIFLIIPTPFERSIPPKNRQGMGPLIGLKFFLLLKESLKTAQLLSYTNHRPIQIIRPVDLGLQQTRLSIKESALYRARPQK